MAARKNLGDLNDYLFAELDRLTEPGMTPEQMRDEIERSRSVSGLAAQVISNASTMLKAAELGAISNVAVPAMLGTGD